MTNYEYLVLTDRLKDFMDDMAHYYSTPWEENIYKKWGIPALRDNSIGGDLAKWLQEESKIANACIKLGDVIDLMQVSDLFDLNKWQIRKLESLVDENSEDER